MTLTYDELELLIQRISLGKEFLYIGDAFIVINHPDNKLKVQAKLIYDKVYKEALKEGLLPKSELETLIMSKGLYNEQDEKAVSKLKSQIEAQEVLLSKTTKVRARKDKIIQTINELKDEMNRILYKKYSKLSMSADTKAEEESNIFLCTKCVKLEDGTFYWDTMADFERDNSDDKQIIIRTFLNLFSGIELSTIRYIVRSGLWRLRYNNSAKSIDSLFGVPSTEYTVDQLNIVHWSDFYDRIYNMSPEDRPSDDVIDDDEQLDKYMEDYYKGINNDNTLSRNQKARNKGQLSSLNAEEVIITQSNELYQEIEYDTPKEAQHFRDRTDIKKRTSNRRR